MAFAAMTSHSSAVAFTACSQPQLPQAVLRTSMSRPASTRVQLQQRSRVLQQRRSTRIPTQAFSSVEAAPASSPVRTETVADVMTVGTIHSVHPDTTVDQALELLVSNSVTGMPVLDDDGTVVGVVSDYDLLSLEGIAEPALMGTGIFPELSMEWSTFRDVQRLMSKNAGKTVADVMTEDPLVVRPETNMAAAAKVLLDQKVRRLPVVDDRGRLLGIFTRRDVIKAALATRKAAAGL
mmetsp:Transcript_17158/g.51336  ORF Transcript_17158/g.51336 Transcript_17158/m.51336 type:complete len:237 (-) Transcript_17158:1211-1921(-)|eukprot:CAMPEP_0206136256 /NCGR_PEP_ID=MMETSP1473-20131121/1498_1 /ASSEMBLY_ACC=CAM_ASM_001109 /TAXON_ID=1461547 /ORGANISM="Stichococcus sp, Strain RCC1054" /LENGTH=236 /DNA_ID=CAMNT_0053528657 /DNA_START=182 /DNA_END=892 /DNA_ORIENTATION=-